MKRVTVNLYGSEFTFMADDAEGKRLLDAYESNQRDQFRCHELYEQYRALDQKLSEAKDMRLVKIEDFGIEHLAALPSKAA